MGERRVRLRKAYLLADFFDLGANHTQTSGAVVISRVGVEIQPVEHQR